MIIDRWKKLLGGCFFFVLVVALVVMVGQSALAASYGTSLSRGQDYTIIHQISVSNPTNRDMQNVTVTLPLISTDGTCIWQKSLGEELNPYPQYITNNGNNRDATYTIGTLPAGDSVQIDQRFKVTNYSLNYKLNFNNYEYNEADLSKINKKYLQAEPGIEVNSPDILYYAKSKTQDINNPYLMAKSLFLDINLYMTYDNSVTNHSAVRALKTGRGNCVDYSYLYIACLRSLGIPARIYTGYLYSPDHHSTPDYINQDGTINMSRLKHNWVEFYVAGMGWVVADPTFTYYIDNNGITTKSVDWTRFAEISSANRLLALYPSEDSASTTYSGSTAPVVTYNTKLSLTEDVSKFYDLAGHWAREDVLALCNRSSPVVYGKSEHYFGVNENITRAELVVMLNRVLESPSDEPRINPQSQGTVNFTDVSDKYWAYAAIQKAVAAGYVVGFPDGTFQPEKPVTRAEMMSILNSICNLPNKSGSPFRDLDVNGFRWAKSAIENCYNANFANGITSTTFVPDKCLTRGEAAAFINRWIHSEYY